MKTLPISILKPDPRNPRRIGEQALAGLATSMEDFGDLSGIVFNEKTGNMVCGHQRLKGLGLAGVKEWTRDGATGYIEHPKTGERFGVRIVKWDRTKEQIANLVANNPEIQGEFTPDAIKQLEELDEEAHYEELRLGALADRLEEELAAELREDPKGGNTDPDDVPTNVASRTKPGDLWVMGDHRLLCGDTTDPALVEKANGGGQLVMLSADPPYGMGKEADGVQNDNLYEEKLDAFQMKWWRAWAKPLSEVGSVYIWGNAPDLWRLWWRGGLCDDPELLVRNEIVWDKGSGFGMRSEGAHSFPPATERCLFLMRGQQFLGNQNKEDYWQGYEPLRSWLEAERNKAGWVNSDVNRITDTKMAGHWFTQSQFAVISRAHYEVLTKAAGGKAFTEPYDALFSRLFPDAKAGGNAYRRELAARLRESRTYFDNAHDAMTDVWQFPRVHGEERHGHATPKPVAMIERCLRSSSGPGDTIGAPFGGTGPEFIAAERLGRKCVGMELTPGYCDVIVSRWEAYTGQKAKVEEDCRGK